MNRLAGPWLMELDDSLLDSSFEVEGGCWDRLVARLTVTRERSSNEPARPVAGALCPRQVVADIERLVSQLTHEVDQLLAHFDPALASLAGDEISWTSAERASLLAHASSALVERGDAPTPERA